MYPAETLMSGQNPTSFLVTPSQLWLLVCRVTGQDRLASPAAVSLLLASRGVQTVVLSSLPAPVASLPDSCAQLVQNCQSKTVAEAVQVLRKTDNSGLLVYGLLVHKASNK